MLRVLLEAANQPDKPLKKLSYEMNWNIIFTSEDIANIEIYVKMMDPMEKLFSSLNSEKESTIHLCYPTVLVTLTSSYFCFIQKHYFHRKQWPASPLWQKTRAMLQITLPRNFMKG